MAFDIVEADAGSGGAQFAFDEFTDTDAVAKIMPYTALAFGSLNGPYTVVNATDRFPVAAAQNGTWSITNVSGTISLPTGASTAALQTAGNASLVSIDSKITACDTGAVVIASSALPSGASTAANQSTIIGHLDGVEGLLATIDADTSVLAAADLMLGTDFSSVLGTSSLLADLNTGAGTDTRLAVGLLRAEGSGAILVGSAAPLPVTDTVNNNNIASMMLAPQADNHSNAGSALKTASLGYVFDGTAWDRLRGDATDGMLVNLGTNNDVTVTGSVTANAGTDLNTSLLALESGGNLALAVSSLSTLDDWDESDRAKVNLIVGQAGITAGAGAVALNTPRMTLASDDPAVALLTTIDVDTGIISTKTTETAASLVTLNEYLNSLTTWFNEVEETKAMRITDDGGSITVDDGGLSLTVDGTVTISGTVTVDSELTTADLDTGAGTDSRAVVGLVGSASGGGQLIPGSATDGLLVNLGANNDVTITGTVTVTGTVTADTELTTADLDTGAGSNLRAVVGLLGSADGGGQIIPGSSTDGLLVNLGSNNDVTVTGTVTANAGTNLNTSLLALETGGNLAAAASLLSTINDDTASLVNIDYATGSDVASLGVVGGGTEAAALRVTIANDSTGVLSIDDNGSSITVDGTVGISGTVTVGSHAVTNAGTFAVQESKPTTGTLANVATSTSNATLIASNASRKGAIIFNDSTSILYVKLGATASATSFSYKVAAGQHLELPHPVYTGIVDGILSASTGTARVTELT